MQTEAELEAKATQAERWRRPLAVLFVVLACFCVALWGGGRRDSALLLYLLEHGWPTSTPLLFFLASAMTGVTSGWLEWRISRLADAIARARTVADISGNPNPRVGVLGESDPRPRK